MKASEHFDLPVSAGSANCNGDDLFGAYGNGIWHATFCSQEQAQIAARCINHADALADALEALVVECENYAANFKSEYYEALDAVTAYRGAK